MNKRIKPSDKKSMCFLSEGLDVSLLSEQYVSEYSNRVAIPLYTIHALIKAAFSVPGMRESLRKGLETPLKECSQVLYE